MTYCMEQAAATESIILESDKLKQQRHGNLQQQWLKYQRQEPEDDYTARNQQVRNILYNLLHITH